VSLGSISCFHSGENYIERYIRIKGKGNYKNGFKIGKWLYSDGLAYYNEKGQLDNIFRDKNLPTSEATGKMMFWDNGKHFKTTYYRGHGDDQKIFLQLFYQNNSLSELIIYRKNGKAKYQAYISENFVIEQLKCLDEEGYITEYPDLDFYQLVFQENIVEYI